MCVMNTTREKRIKKAISERQLKDKEDLKNLILKSAAAILLDKGYEKFSLRQVAESIGYSATTIYLYFKDKDDLLFSVVSQGFRIFFDMLSFASENAKDLEGKIKATGIAYVKFAIENPLYYQIMFMSRGDLILKNFETYENTPITNSLKLLENLVIEAVEKGLLKKEYDTKYYVRVIWSAVHGVASLYIAMPFDYIDSEILKVAEISVNMTFKGLKA